jgi:hypothetical protein
MSWTGSTPPPSPAGDHPLLPREPTASAALPRALARKKESMPDVGLALTLVARALHETTATLVDASQKHDAELADDDAPRQARPRRADRR